MLFDRNHEQRLAALQRHLRGFQAITPEFMRDVMARACLRSQTYPAATKSRIDALIATEAWIDTALALLKLELPQWRLRRLVYDDGEWHCSLSNQPALPVELDDSVEAVHAIPALAILCALVEARSVAVTPDEVRPKSVPHVRTTPGHIVCCDNFA